MKHSKRYTAKERKWERRVCAAMRRVRPIARLVRLKTARRIVAEERSFFIKGYCVVYVRAQSGAGLYNVVEIMPKGNNATWLPE